MNGNGLSPFDAEVRSALDPEPGAAQRVASRALSAGGSRRPRTVAPLVALLAVATAAIWFAIPPTASAPDKAQGVESARLVVNHGGVVSAVDPVSVSFASDSVRRRPSTPRTLIIVHGGDS